MKTIQAGKTVALLIVVGGMIPMFGQSRSNRQSGDYNGADRGRTDSAAREDRRNGGREFRQRDAHPQIQQQQRDNGQQRSSGQQPFQPQNNDGGERQEFRQRDVQPQFQHHQQDNRQQFSQQQYRPTNSYRDRGSSYGFASRDGARWADRGGYRGRFIPQNRFDSYFGRQHWFRIGRPLYDNGFARFSYGGYAFQILDPVPAYWGQDWYDSDDVYVDYEDDGYYMYNRSYPGAGIAVNVEF